jgi:hypothetical protein
MVTMKTIKKATSVEEAALETSTGWIDTDGLLGYFGLHAANILVGTGKYQWHQVCAWGYILKRVVTHSI